MLKAMKKNLNFPIIAGVIISMLVSIAQSQENPASTMNFKEMSAQERQAFFEKYRKQVNKVQQEDMRHDITKETIIEGNQIRVLLTNQGSISTPNADASNSDLVWPKGPDGLGYAYEFGPLVAAEVFSPDGDTLHIVSDGFLSSSDGDFEPGTGGTVRWGWEPRLGFSDPNSNEVATFSDLDRDGDGKPDSWPEIWYNPVLGRYVWPAFLGDDATTPDEEVFYVMDDFDNVEFPYYPNPTDSTMRGLGLELQVRIFQFNNPLAEDLIFLVYTVTNVSPTRLDKVYLGMFGDPHVGGYQDFDDDFAGFISAFDNNFEPNTRNMLYAYDNPPIGMFSKTTGEFGYRFLESPGIDDDNFDNDNDGLVDESQINDAGSFIFGPVGRYGDPKFHWSGDEDGDWVEEFDDIGVDGIPNTGDYGEGDGQPTQLFYLDLNNNSVWDPGSEPFSETRDPGMRFHGGEPNFGFVDIAESDQLGLTSFNALIFGGNNRPKNDELMWEKMSTTNQRPGDPPPEIQQEDDNVFIYGSGPFTLEPGEAQRFSIVLLMGLDRDDLLNNAKIAQQVFEADYRFAQAPNKPKLVAIPGDKEVILYWDTGAESSFDPFVARANPDSMEKGFDFEGYKIYRSRDYSFNDTQTITDSRGIPFLSEPLKDETGMDAQFDIINEYSGLSDIEYAGRGVRYNLGRNSGLVHSYVDSNNVLNGVTYFYAVTSYDRGDVNAELAPTESQRVVKRDAVTRLFSFDINTAMAVPNSPATGFVKPTLTNGLDNYPTQEVGDGTGTVWIDFLNPLQVQEEYKYELVFEEVEVDSAVFATGYSVFELQDKEKNFISQDTNWVTLVSGVQITDGSVSVTDLSGNPVDPGNYEVDFETARIRGTSVGSLPEGEAFTVTYRLKPVAESVSMNAEDDNPVFDGMRVLVQDDPAGLDSLSTKGGRSGFSVINTSTNFADKYTSIRLAEVGTGLPYPTDFEIRFANYDTLQDGSLVAPEDSAITFSPSQPAVKTNFKIIDVATGERVDFFINEVSNKRNLRWDYQETIVLIQPNATQPTQTTYQVKFSPPIDTLTSSTGEDSLVVQPAFYPGQGDVFLFFSTKPFDIGDKYSFETRAASFQEEMSESVLNEVYVVPNPYIAYSSAEIAFRTGVRDDRRLEFRNLPKKCTIRIYTIVGELVDTIEKNDPTNYATWDMLTFESQEIAYGVYIYHVDAPGVGTKIGRFAVIK